jgi:hypothetical protein
MRFDKSLKPSELTRMIRFLKGHHPGTCKKMTAGIFFDYCKIAYLANPKSFSKDFNPKLSGKDLYLRWADGRDGGLRDLPLHSEKAFENWYNGSGRQGCHPWEIYRGGNSTHIDLAVARTDSYGLKNSKDWKVYLSAFASSRLAETCKIALALNKAKLPFELYDRKSYLLRLMGQDWVGVLPEKDSLAYGWHDFPKEYEVADSIHFSFFKDDDGKSLRPIKEIKKLVCWLPIKPLKLK